MKSFFANLLGNKTHSDKGVRRSVKLGCESLEDRLAMSSVTGAPVQEIQSTLGAPGDGIFGPATQYAVSRFQSDQIITADGLMGPQTLAILNNQNLVQLPTKDLHLFPGEVVRFLPGDGILGPAAVNAIRVFQSDYGLAPDGVVGPWTKALTDPVSQEQLFQILPDVLKSPSAYDDGVRANLEATMQELQNRFEQVSSIVEQQNQIRIEVIRNIPINGFGSGFGGGGMSGDNGNAYDQVLWSLAGQEDAAMQVIQNLRPRVAAGSSNSSWTVPGGNPYSNPFWNDPAHLMPLAGWGSQVMTNAGWVNVDTIGQVYTLGSPQEFGIDPGVSGTLVGNYSSLLGGIRNPAHTLSGGGHIDSASGKGSKTPATARIFAEATGRTPATSKIIAEATGRTAATTKVFAEATGRTPATSKIIADATGRTAATTKAFAEATQRTPATARIFAEATGRTTATSRTYAAATGRTAATTKVFAEATGRTAATTAIVAEATLSTPAATKVFAEATLRTPETAKTYAEATGRTPAAAKTFAHATGRTAADAALFKMATGRI